MESRKVKFVVYMIKKLVLTFIVGYSIAAILWWLNFSAFNAGFLTGSVVSMFIWFYKKDYFFETFKKE